MAIVILLNMVTRTVSYWAKVRTRYRAPHFLLSSSRHIFSSKIKFLEGLTYLPTYLPSLLDM